MMDGSNGGINGIIMDIQRQYHSTALWFWRWLLERMKQ
jgi:hypothetical protein